MDAFSIPAPLIGGETPSKIGVKKSDSPEIDRLKLPMSWGEYDAWRASKCMPQEIRPPIWIDELDQSVHEMVGETSELADLLFTTTKEDRDSDRVLDEIGDVVFTSVWVISACGVKSIDDFLATYFREMDWSITDREEASPALLSSVAMVFAGSCSNAFKKARWQARPSKMKAIPDNAFGVLYSVAAIAKLLGFTLGEAMSRNVVKLNDRYPNGWELGGGKRG